MLEVRKAIESAEDPIDLVNQMITLLALQGAANAGKNVCLHGCPGDNEGPCVYLDEFALDLDTCLIRLTDGTQLSCKLVSCSAESPFQTVAERDLAVLRRKCEHGCYDVSCGICDKGGDA